MLRTYRHRKPWTSHLVNISKIFRTLSESGKRALCTCVIEKRSEFGIDMKGKFSERR